MPDPTSPVQPAGAPPIAGVPAPAVAGQPVPAGRPPLDSAALDARAVALGFDDLEDMIAALEEPDVPADTLPTTPSQETVMSDPVPPAAAPAAAPPAAAPVVPSPASIVAGAAQPAGTPPSGPSDDPAEDRRLPENVRRNLRRARDEMKQKTAAAEAAATAAATKATGYEQQIARMKAEENLKIELVRSGIRDLEFAWHTMTQHLAELGKDKTPEGIEKLKAFDATAWAGEQRKTRPYLFGDQPVPANTGAPTGAAPPQPGAGPVAAGVGQAGAFDARTASQAEYQKRMAALGVSTSGRPSPPLRGY